CSITDISAVLIHVRFTPKSGHQLNALGCPLCAKSRHHHCSATNSMDPMKTWVVLAFFLASAFAPNRAPKHPTILVVAVPTAQVLSVIMVASVNLDCGGDGRQRS
ncbi:MAG: hypothetical protein WAV38_22420, partial [Xanthobacteraceae bacterium]